MGWGGVLKIYHFPLTMNLLNISYELRQEYIYSWLRHFTSLTSLDFRKNFVRSISRQALLEEIGLPGRNSEGEGEREREGERESKRERASKRERDDTLEQRNNIVELQQTDTHTLTHRRLHIRPNG